MIDTSAPSALPARRSLPGRDLSARAVAGTTIAVFIALSVPQFWPDYYKRVFGGDFGLVHMTQAALLVAALAVGLHTLLRRDVVWPKGAKWGVGLVTLGLFVLLGEDFEWGQDLFGWQTAGWFAEHNDEGETNFHNTSVWLDQYPRALLYLGMLLGAIVHPLMVHFSGRGLFDRWPEWFVPTLASTPPAIASFVAWLPKLIDKSHILDDIKLQVGRASERQEVFIYLFMLVFMLSLASRLRRSGEAEGAA